jgi:hypothetical protein
MTTPRKKEAVRPAEKAIQFKVQLCYLRPPIWRRVVLPDNATLGDLHQVVQLAMGWDNCHMHSFRIGGVYYTSRDASAMEAMDMENEERVPLAEIVMRPRQKFIYEYDFGDSWEHEIVAEKFLPLDPATTYPVCLGGARACPPEDCGSFPGYEDILAAVKASKPTEEQEDLLEWAGKDYDPEHFDIDLVNHRLGAVNRKRPKTSKS